MRSSDRQTRPGYCTTGAPLSTDSAVDPVMILNMWCPNVFLCSTQWRQPFSSQVTASELIISQTTSRRALQPVKAAVYKLRPTSEIEKTTLCTVHAIEDVRGNNSGCCDQSSRRLSVSCVRYYSHSNRIDDGAVKRSVDIQTYFVPTLQAISAIFWTQSLDRRRIKW